jgi:hypothetical protein
VFLTVVTGVCAHTGSAVTLSIHQHHLLLAHTIVGTCMRSVRVLLYTGSSCAASSTSNGFLICVHYTTR